MCSTENKKGEVEKVLIEVKVEGVCIHGACQNAKNMYVSRHEEAIEGERKREMSMQAKERIF